jgi:hypothetical protein
MTVETFNKNIKRNKNKPVSGECDNERISAKKIPD